MRGEVVGAAALAALELVGAVARLLRLAVDEHHHRGHRVRPLHVRDVVALDHPRQLRQAQPLLQLGQHRLGVVAGVAPAGEAGGGVLARQLDQVAPRPALRHQHLDLAPARARPPARPAQLGQPLRLQLGVGDGERQQHLVGHRRRQVVVQAEEARQDLRVRELLVGEARTPGVPAILPCADGDDHDLQGDALAVKADHVLVDEVRATPPAATPATTPARRI